MKKVNDIHSLPLIYLLHRCSQIVFGIGNELKPRLCVSSGGSSPYRNAVLHLTSAGELCRHHRTECIALCEATYLVLKCSHSMCKCPRGHFTKTPHVYRLEYACMNTRKHTGAYGDGQKTKHTHTHAEPQSITHRKNMRTL